MAINKAASEGMCGEACGSSTIQGAIIYFPVCDSIVILFYLCPDVSEKPGKYLISSPIIQYYYSLFIGDANSVPHIIGSANFTGIALIDTDFYIPGGNGAEWCKYSQVPYVCAS
jgi:glucan 1,3-beta-glucosidase